MSFADTLDRIRKVLFNRQQGRDPATRLVQRDDLHALLRDWTRLDLDYRSLFKDYEAMKARALAAEARIAELEAPVLPGDVARVVERLRNRAVARASLKKPSKIDVADAELDNQAAAILTRLSSFSEEVAATLQAMVDEQVEYMTINHLGDPEAQHNIKRARAALTAYLRQTGERG